MTAGGYGYNDSYAIVLVLFILLAIIGCVCWSGYGC